MGRQQHRLLEDLDDRRPEAFPAKLGMGLLWGMIFGGLPTLGLFVVLGLEVTGNSVVFAVWVLVALLVAILFVLHIVEEWTQKQWDENLLLRKEIARLDADHDLLSLRVRSLSESRTDTMEEIIELRKSMRELQREVRRSRRLDG